jgi:hypothetical protein
MNTTSVMNFTEIEHVLFYKNFSSNKVIGILTIITILLVNLPLLKCIFRHGYGTFMNKLIILDCCLCICNIGPVFTFSIWDERRYSELCFLPFGFLLILLNRFLSISIGFYHYVFVFRSSWVKTKYQRKKVLCLVSGAVVMLSFTLTALCIYYRNQNFHFLGNISVIIMAVSFVCQLKKYNSL